MRLALPLLLLSVGCDVASVNMPFDDDGDGLMTDVEEQIGTDPDNPDSDGDGYEDGAEHDDHTDPLDADDHPYLAGWPIDACRTEMDPNGSGGNAQGDTAANFALTDQWGETVHLHDFCGQVVLMEASAFW